MRAGDWHGGSVRGRAQLPPAPWYGAFVIVLVLGACTHGSRHANSPRRKATNQPSTTTGPSTSSTTLPPPTTSSTQPPPTNPPSTGLATPTACRSARLTLSAGPQNGAAGTQYFEIAFRNDGSSPCRLTGFPGVSFLDASGNQIGVPAERDAVSYRPVTIAPHTSAFARVGVGNPGVFDCAGVTPADIRVFPPNETAAVVVPPPTGLLACPTEGTPFVEPVVDHAVTDW